MLIVLCALPPIGVVIISRTMDPTGRASTIGIIGDGAPWLEAVFSIYNKMPSLFLTFIPTIALFITWLALNIKGKKEEHK